MSEDALGEFLAGECGVRARYVRSDSRVQCPQLCRAWEGLRSEPPTAEGPAKGILMRHAEVQIRNDVPAKSSIECGMRLKLEAEGASVRRSQTLALPFSEQVKIAAVVKCSHSRGVPVSQMSVRLLVIKARAGGRLWPLRGEHALDAAGSGRSVWQQP